MKLSLAPYSKTIASFIGTGLLWAAVAYVPDGTVDRTEWYALALKLAVDVGVFGVTNGPRKSEPAVSERGVGPWTPAKAEFAAKMAEARAEIARLSPPVTPAVVADPAPAADPAASAVA